MAAIENKQAAIKGIPCIADEEASSITRMVLALRGINGKKQIEAWERGELRAVPQKLKLQSLATGWQKATPMKEDWIAEKCKEKEEEEEQKDKTKRVRQVHTARGQVKRRIMKKTPEANVLHQQQQQHEKFAQEEHAKIVEVSLKRELPLKSIACPRCNVQQDPARMKLITQAGFSNIQCRACGDVTSSSQWRCRCRCLWMKCHIHIHRQQKPIKQDGMKKSHMKRKSKFDQRGVDEPIPIRRDLKVKATHSNPIYVNLNSHSIQSAMSRPRLKPGSRLAARFPHLVQAASPT